MKVTRDCLFCQRPFKAHQKEVNRGFGKFCSRSCSAQYNGAKSKLEPNCVCTFCQTPFYRSNSQKKRAKSSGLLFCSRSCKDKAQRLDSGISEIWPTHYGINSDYREKALSCLPKRCDVCGYDKHPEVLQVHHRDGNRKNNVLENLQVLCPTCHTVEHFQRRGLIPDLPN